MKKPTLPKIPKYARRIAYWDKDKKCGLGFIMVGYCPDTLDYFLALYNRAQKSFPSLKMSECTIGKVSKSNWNYGFTIIAFSVSSVPRGWEKRALKSLDFNY